MFLPAPGPAAGGVLLTFGGWIWEAGNSREIQDFLADCWARPRIEAGLETQFSSIQREGNSGGILFVPPERAAQGQRVMENGKEREILTFPGISRCSIGIPSLHRLPEPLFLLAPEDSRLSLFQPLGAEIPAFSSSCRKTPGSKPGNGNGAIPGCLQVRVRSRVLGLWGDRSQRFPPRHSRGNPRSQGEIELIPWFFWDLGWLIPVADSSGAAGTPRLLCWRKPGSASHPFSQWGRKGNLGIS